MKQNRDPEISVRIEPLPVSEAKPGQESDISRLTAERDAARQEAENLREQYERLRESGAQEQMQHRTLTESLPQLVWATTPEGSATYFNSRWSQFTGTPPENLLGTGWLTDLHPDDRERVAAIWQAAYRSRQPYEAEYRVRGKNGSYRRFLARGVPVTDAQGQIVQIVGTTTDITDQVADRERDRLLRKIADGMRLSQNPQQVLANVAQELGWFLHTARVFFADVDAEGNLNIVPHGDFRREPDSPPFAEPAAVRVLPGVFQAWRVGLTVTFADLADDPRTRETYAETFAPYGLHSLMAVPMHRDGQWASVLMLADDAPRQWQKEEIEMVEAVAERACLAVENARLYEAERSKTRRLEESFAEMHHRVKNNLQVIAALLDMRVMDDDEDAAPVTRQDLQRIVGNVHAIAAVHDFLAHHQAAMTVSAREVLRRLVPMVARTAHVTAAWESDEATLSVEQGTALALILNETVSNAGKHGGKNVVVTLRHEADTIALAIADDGPGFPPDFLPERDAHQGVGLIISLAQRDLRGSITFGNGETGGTVRIRFRHRADAATQK